MEVAIPLRLVRGGAVDARPIDAQWRCQRDGSCCLEPRDVVMTTMEAGQILQRTAGAVALEFRKTQEHFVALKAHPCPLYDAETKACTVYDIRPYNCRRFACLRPDPTHEPWQADPLSGACVNRDERAQRSRIARRILRAIQAKAQPWARAHGWSTS